MHEIFIIVADSPDTEDNDPSDIINNPRLGGSKVPIELFVNPPKINWTDTFAYLSKFLPELTEFSFQRLFYGRASVIGRQDANVTPIVPVSEEYETVVFENFMERTEGKGLISPFKKDNVALRVFRKEVEGRRWKDGLMPLVKKEGFGIFRDEREEMPPLWHFLFKC
ncbi:hypothetical protein TWF281_002217 [Arthrobotrys megalospora]